MWVAVTAAQARVAARGASQPSTRYSRWWLVELFMKTFTTRMLCRCSP